MSKPGVMKRLWLAALIAVVCSCWIPTSEGECKPRKGCSTALAYYQLVNDDTLLALAQRFTTTVEDVQKYNDIRDPSFVQIADPVLFPFSCECIDGELVHNFLYEVVLQDTVSDIAEKKFQRLTTLERISQATGLKNPDMIFPPQKLKIPVNCSCGDPNVSPDYGLFITYPLRSGDNISGLASQFGKNETLLRQYNPSISWNSFSVGDIIYVPSKVYSTGRIPAYNFTADVEDGGGDDTNVGLIVGVSIGGAVAVALLVFAFCFFCFCWRRREAPQSGYKPAPSSGRVLGGHGSSGYRESRRESEMLKYSGNGVGGSRASTVGVPSLTDFTVDKSVEFTFEELETATNKFSAANKIGEGGYGSVYFANLRGQKMAVKRMNLQATREFLAELQVLTHVHHTNLVQLIGYCTVDSLFLIYEYIENGTLDRHLQRKNDLPPLTWSARVQIALDAARGLEYIHEHTKPTYIHRDVKSSNILIDRQFHAKVADFGLTKLTEARGGSFSQNLPTRLVGTFGYMSPEYARFGDVSPKLDVYSFGVVLFEIISAKEAIVRISAASSDGTGPRKEEQRGLVTFFEGILQDAEGKEKLRTLVDPALGSDYPLESAWKMAQLAGACTQENPELRPSMRNAVVALMTLSSTTQEWELHAYGSERISTGLISGR